MHTTLPFEGLVVDFDEAGEAFRAMTASQKAKNQRAAGLQKNAILSLIVSLATLYHVAVPFPVFTFHVRPHVISAVSVDASAAASFCFKWKSSDLASLGGGFSNTASKQE